MKNMNKAWKCLICGEVIMSENPPVVCPVCNAGSTQFVVTETKEVTFMSQEPDNFIIVGGGIAALTAATEIRKRNRICRIEIISNEDVFCYNRPMLTKGILSEFDISTFFPRQLDWYREMNIKTTLDTEVTEIDRGAKEVVLSDGTRKPYDKLIYATGAECNVPPIKGHEKDGVKVIRKLSDVNAIREKTDEIENVVVIGGGILGLEAAWELVRAGKHVTVIEVSNKIMGRQLDEKGSSLLQSMAEAKGAVISTAVGIDEISGEGKVECVKMADGTIYPAELVVISAGTKPNAELAKKAGLDADRFVNVNEKLETSDPSIYACGDVAACNGVCIGIWPQAEEMGKVAGANAVGDNVVYEPIVPANSFSGFGTSLFSIGDIGHDPEVEYDEVEHFDEAGENYKKLYFLDGKFCGGILIGDVSETADLIEEYLNK